VRAGAERVLAPGVLERRGHHTDVKGVHMRRLIVGTALATVGITIAATPAAADHVHFRVVGNGECVLLAPDGGEQHVELPHADEYAPNRRHPLHVNVHLGRPGDVGQVFVADAADGVLTADAQRLCGGVFVNR
jgi:hypothetical protein